MENPIQNRIHTNHDRDSWTNGVNGGLVKPSIFSDKGKSLPANMANGGYSSMMDVDSEPQGGPVRALVPAHPSTVDEPPDEIEHITADILPLSKIVSRLAQFSFAKLQEQILALAAKPLPQNLANGNADYQFTGAEDTSQESLEKKVSLLKFAQDLHTRWVKALVISEWSKKADKVSKLIDIRAHLATKLEDFNYVFIDMINNKRELNWAKVPSPDLKTALAVLSFGEAYWWPDYGYLEPPPLSVEEMGDWIENINTMLSVRLTLDEYENIPVAFKNYTISSGRVTFRIEGEFEVDLTIGDEDFQQQFWFIDFRFLFTPAPPEITGPMRAALETKINDILGNDGLRGCYRYLHEFVLTQKVTEFWRQALEMSRGRWIDTLKVERLNRSMSIQYWANRSHSQPTKSWIILGVNSNNGPDGIPDPSSPSRLTLRWFRDSKEVKDTTIPLDATNISAEDLLTAVISRHVEHLLGSIFTKLLAKPRFAQRHAQISLGISQDDPSSSSLTVQLFDSETATVRIDGMTGYFSMLPQFPVIQGAGEKLNQSPNPAEEGLATMEQLRVFYTLRDLNSRTKSIGWTITRSPLAADELKNMIQPITQSREPFTAAWLRKTGWAREWWVIMTMSLGGDHWWLVELSQPGPRVKAFSKLPMTSAQITLTDHFFDNLTVYATAVVQQMTDIRELHLRKIGHSSKPSRSAGSGPPSEIRAATLHVRLSDMLRSDGGERRPMAAAWAEDFVSLDFSGLQGTSLDQLGMTAAATSQPRRDIPQTKAIVEVRLTVNNRRKFQLLKGHIDRDVTFDSHLGQFTLRLRSDMGVPILTQLASRIRSLERLADIVDAIRRAGKDVAPVSATLRSVVFKYGNTGDNNNSAPPRPGSREYRVRLEFTNDKQVNISLDKDNPHMRVIDLLREAVNGPGFLEVLPSWLLWTLPLFRGLARVQEIWAGLGVKKEALLQVYHKSLNMVTLRFTLSPRRILFLDIKCHKREGKTVWHISRTDTALPGTNDNNPNPTPSRQRDEFDRVLQRVWSAQLDGVVGLGTSAVADPEKGIEKLLSMIDTVVRTLVGTPPVLGPALGGSGPAAAAQNNHQRNNAGNPQLGNSSNAPVVVLD